MRIGNPNMPLLIASSPTRGPARAFRERSRQPIHPKARVGFRSLPTYAATKRPVATSLKRYLSASPSLSPDPGALTSLGLPGLFCCRENRDAHSRRAPSRLVPAGLPARRHLPGHPSPTRFACRKTQCDGLVGVWVAVSTHRITSFSPSRSA